MPRIEFLPEGSPDVDLSGDRLHHELTVMGAPVYVGLPPAANHKADTLLRHAPTNTFYLRGLSGDRYSSHREPAWRRLGRWETLYELHPRLYYLACTSNLGAVGLAVYVFASLVNR